MGELSKLPNIGKVLEEQLSDVEKQNDENEKNNIEIAKENNIINNTNETKEKVVQKSKDKSSKETNEDEQTQQVTTSQENANKSCETEKVHTAVSSSNIQKKEEPKVTVKDEITYNSAATQKIINDINDLARQNPDLWDANGNKLYKIETSSSLLGRSYMSPYRREQVAGKVLNSFPVKFLVYAVDVKKQGYTNETRYYIDITNY